MNIGQLSALGTASAQSPVPSAGMSSRPPDISFATASVPPGTSPVSTATPASAAGNSASVDQNALKQSVDTINNYLSSVGNNSVQFSIESATGQVVVQVVDT